MTFTQLPREERRRIAKREWAKRERADPARRASRREYERERRRKNPQKRPLRYVAQAYRSAVIDFLIKRDGFACGFCGDSLEGAKIHVNHIVPAALGGADTLENFNLAHAYCNVSEGQVVRAEKARRGAT